MTKAPDLTTTIPPVLSMATPAAPEGRRIPAACYPNTPAARPPAGAATTCAWGDRTAKRVVVLTGDSQAAMWLSALSVAGQTLHFKLVMLAEPGCAPWGSPNPAGFVIFSNVTVANCDAWHHAVVAASAALHPALVIMAGRAYPHGADQDVTAPLGDFEARASSAVAAYKAAGLKVALFSAFPSYNSHRTPGLTPAYCLAYVTPITTCELSPATMLDPTSTVGLRAVAASEHVALVNVTAMFCSKSRCAIFVRASGVSHLVYFDPVHMNHWYSNWIGDALASKLTSLI